MVAVPSIGRASQVTPRRAAPEADATRDLYERYARQIFAYCLHQLGNREEAEDATQSTFLNVFRGYQRGVDPEFESAWVYKIAQNVCLTRQRSSSRRRRVETPGDLDAMQDILPSHQADSDELIRLPEALGEMPEQQRRALLLREWQGLSYKEIADELGLSQAAVETLLFRARRTLAAGLTEEPKAKTLGQKLRTGGDLGSILALVKTLLFSGGAKVAATVVTVAATSVVAATPAVRHTVEHALAPAPQHPKPAVSAPLRAPLGLVPAAHVVRAHPAASASAVGHAPLSAFHTAALRAADVKRASVAPPAHSAVHRTPAVVDPPAPAPAAPAAQPVTPLPAPAPEQPAQSDPPPAAAPAQPAEHPHEAPQSNNPVQATSPAAKPADKGDGGTQAQAPAQQQPQREPQSSTPPTTTDSGKGSGAGAGAGSPSDPAPGATSSTQPATQPSSSGPRAPGQAKKDTGAPAPTPTPTTTTVQTQSGPSNSSAGAPGQVKKDQAPPAPADTTMTTTTQTVTTPVASLPPGQAKKVDTTPTTTTTTPTATASSDNGKGDKGNGDKGNGRRK